ILRVVDRLPHCEVDVSASDSGRAGNLWRSGLADVSVSAAGIPSVSLRCRPRRSWGGFAYRLAPRVRGERTTMEWAVQRAGSGRYAFRRSDGTSLGKSIIMNTARASYNHARAMITVSKEDYLKA